MTYEEALSYVASLAPRGWRLGLDRMSEFLRQASLEDALGRADKPKYIHVAGTNGKGSVTAYLQSILHESGYRVGSFFSPYVYDPRERIQLGRELIPEKIFAGLTAMLQPVAEEFTDTEFGGITEFEFKTALAFLFYKRLQCEWVALEVGLGGRLDATNVVTPRCSVIVSIGLDHVAILGNTLAEIAREKAGIIKPGVPVIVGQLPPEAMMVVVAEAEKNASPVWRYGQEIQVAQDASDGSFVVITPRGEHAGLSLGIRGAMQGHNMALAVAACDAAGATRTLAGLQKGSLLARSPGRFEVRHLAGKTIILDGAHNGEAATVLAQSLETFFRVDEQPPMMRELGRKRLHLVTGMVQGHESDRMYAPLAPYVQQAYTVPIDFHRAKPPEEVAENLIDLGIPAKVYPSVREGLEEGLRQCREDEAVLITGSFYLVGEAGRILQQME